jgi:hypothetical protein
MTFSGEDTLPATDCAAFADEVASDGLKATMNADYPNGGSATVHVELSP